MNIYFVDNASNRLMHFMLGGDPKLFKVGDHVNITTDKQFGRKIEAGGIITAIRHNICLLYTSPSPRDGLLSRMPSSA